MRKNGFSFIELMVVLLLTTVIASLAGISYSQMKRQEEIRAVVMEVAQIIASGRVKTVSGQDGQDYQVVLTADRVRLETSLSELKEEYYLPPKYQLVSSLGVIQFSRPDGRVKDCESGCVVEIKEKQAGLSHNLRILFSGAVEY